MSPMADFSLEGKVAIVTGGSRGIGRACAVGLAQAGADVAIAARKPEDLAEAHKAIEETGRRSLAVPTNVRQMDALKALVDQTRAELGRVDILVNNAATNPHAGPSANVEEFAWDVTMNTNVKAAFYLSVYAREAMQAHGEGGSIINVSSGAGVAASELLGIYGISKAAMNMMTQVCAKEWGPDNIRVNAIVPGLIKTEFSRALWDNEKILHNATKLAALRRIGMPEEMVGAVVYLASSASSFTTGQLIALDGGRNI